MSGPIGTYNSTVRIGNWNEEIQLEEDTLKEFLEMREKGELQVQQYSRLNAILSKTWCLSVSNDYALHIGDRVMVKCPADTAHKEYSGPSKARKECVVALSVSDPMEMLKEHFTSPVLATGCTSDRPNIRTVFCIESVEGGSIGHKVRYHEPFYLCTVGETHQKVYLCSDRAFLNMCAKKSRHQEVFFSEKPSFLAQWVLQHKNPLRRLEYENVPVEANEEVVLVHRKTNRCLAVEEDFITRTPFGSEYELSTHTYLDSHKAEKSNNRWVLVVGVPGSHLCDVPDQGPGAAPLRPTV